MQHAVPSLAAVGHSGYHKCFDGLRENRTYWILCNYWLSGKAGRENICIWLEFRTYGPRAKYFSVRPSHTVNKYILLYRYERFTGKYTTCKIHTKQHPGPEYYDYQLQLSKARTSFGDEVLELKLRCCHGQLPRFQWQQYCRLQFRTFCC